MAIGCVEAPPRGCLNKDACIKELVLLRCALPTKHAVPKAQRPLHVNCAVLNLRQIKCEVSFCNRCAHLVGSGCSLPIVIRKARCEQGLDIVSAMLQRCSYDKLPAFGFCNSLQIGQNFHRTCASPFAMLQKVLHDKASETAEGKCRRHAGGGEGACRVLVECM